MSIHMCCRDDAKRLLPLLAPKLTCIPPFPVLREADLAPLFDSGQGLSQPVCVALSVGGELRAAALFGVLPEASGPRDFGLIRPGDGLIQWMVCADPAAGSELLGHCRAHLPERVFVCPEFGGLSSLGMFRTGMLPATFVAETVTMLTNGLTLPASDDWGPQERLWFRREIPDHLPELVLPPALTARRETGDSFPSSLKAFDGKETAGECRISQATLFGKPHPGHVYVDWLGVAEHRRNQGLGEKLLVEQMRWARAHGATVCVLTTHSGRPAHRLYRRLGFVGVGAARTYCTC